MAFKSDESEIEIPYELFFKATPLTIYRESEMQSILKNIRHVAMMARVIPRRVGNHSDIRPGWIAKNEIVSHMDELYVLPDIVIPCVVRVDAWIMDAYRKYLSDIYLPEFG